MIVSGLIGLACNFVVYVTVAWVTVSGYVPVLLKGWAGVIALLFLLTVSLAEIPMMVFGLRKLTADPKRTSHGLLLATNAFYIFFAAVYASVLALLTGWPLAGAGLTALGLVRFASALAFVRLDKEIGSYK